MLTSHHFQRLYQNCESASASQSGTSHKTCLGQFGRNGSIAWTSAVSHVGRTSNPFKVTETANIPLSYGSNIMYFCSVFVKIWFCKILRCRCSLYVLLTLVSLRRVSAHLRCHHQGVLTVAAQIWVELASTHIGLRERFWMTTRV